MRPIRLEVEGFASFRDRTVIDFSDANYFALVGPTGSGKSSVIDALTFALYGTAPRWGRLGGIQYALAPTSNRCVVSLIFDSGGSRYQVAREVRRGGGATAPINTKAVSLVRFADRNATEPPAEGEQQPEVMCGEKKELTPTIEKLLGLSFDDFCQCVVLPQGEFARFLQASRKERQDILLKLIGAEHYEEIGRAAGVRAKTAEQKVALLAEQRDKQGDSSPEAEAAATTALATLTETTTQLETLIGPAAAADAARAASAATTQRLAHEIALLDTVTKIPDGIDALSAHHQQTQAHAQAAAAHAAAASQALADATTAASAGPQRAGVERVAALYRDRATQLGRQAELIEQTADLTGSLEEATALRQACEGDVKATTEAHGLARQRLETATTARRTLTARLDRLHGVEAPDGVTELAAQESAARAALAVACDTQQQAHDTHDAAGRSLEEATTAAGATRSQVDAAIGLLDDLDTAAAALRAAHEHLGAAQEQHTAAAAARTDAETTERETRDALERARVEAAAGELRTSLVVGDPCPVCEQDVHHLPGPADDHALSAARTVHDEAHQRLRGAQAAYDRTNSALRTAERTQDTHTTRTQSLLTQLVPLLPTGNPARARFPAPAAFEPGHAHSLPAAVGEQRDVCRRLHDSLTALEADLDATAAARQCAETGVLDAQRATVECEVLLRDAWAALHAQRGALTDLDPPAVDDNIAEAWQALTGWAVAQATELTDGDLAVASATEAVAATDYETAAQALAAATAAAEAARGDHAAAAEAHARHSATLTEVTTRLANIDTALLGAPGEDTLPGLLTECAALEQAVVDATAQSRTAANAATAAATALETATQSIKTAAVDLRTARDSVAPMGPPALTDDLAESWAALAAWATGASTARASELDAAARADHDAASGQEKMRDQVDALLARHDLALTEQHTARDTNRARAAAGLVSLAASEARAALTQVLANRARVEDIDKQIGVATEQGQVARELSTMLRSNRFPQWLATSVLDSLVVSASASLRELSNDQFDLTHREGEFFVIDHADADSERSVRTLSGGETFQASLALALALSDQLAGLATGGVSTLDSIFLDEGFGTLDPDALEVVAATLENLAQGERMVGIVTHVAALADRVPVRFRVHHDTRTSTVTREDGT